MNFSPSNGYSVSLEITDDIHDLFEFVLLFDAGSVKTAKIPKGKHQGIMELQSLEVLIFKEYFKIKDKSKVD